LRKIIRFFAWLLGILVLILLGVFAWAMADQLYTGDLRMTDCKQIKDHIYPPIAEAAMPLYEQANQLRKAFPRTEENAQQAYDLYQQAAELGHWKAEINIAFLIATGRVAAKRGEASKRLERLMEKQVPDAYLQMSTFYKRGIDGKRQSRGKALRLLRQAAELGLPKAQYHLGEYYSAKVEDEEAKKWLHCALDQGYGDAGHGLMFIYKGKQDHKALQALKQGSRYGSKKALSALAGKYWGGGLGLNKDEKRALCINNLEPDQEYPDLDERCPGNVEQPY
jgi:TPR repeat protein